MQRLRVICDENCVQYDVTTPATTRTEMAKRLGDKFMMEWHQKEAHLLESDVSDNDVETNKRAQVAFLQRMVPYWFMTPFTSVSGGAIEQGIANEDQVLRVLPRSLKTMSNNKYTIFGRIREFGLVGKKMHPFCSSSPDGVFTLMKKNTQGTYDFIGICVIEIKTRASENTVDALTESVLRGGLFTECVTGTELFERVIPDNAYRTQICQHATALGVDHVLMVYSLPGANVKKLVLVGVSVEHRYELLKFQTLLATKYMPFCYVENHSKDIPSLGTDYSKAYGYAQDHHTLELYLYLWHAHNKDVVENGTPPPCRRLIYITFSYWNKMMGNVDIMRKVLEKRKAVRGPDSSPGSLMWFSLLGYTIYNAFRLYQHAQLERKLKEYKTFKQFQKARQLMTYTSFLFKLGVGPKCLCERAMVQYYPGLKEHLNHNHCVQDTAAGVGGARPDVDSTETTTGYKCHAYNMIEAFLRTDSEKYHLRLDATKPHKSVSLSK